MFDKWQGRRWLPRRDAALFLNMTIAQFNRHEGNLPSPSDILGPRNLRWDRDALFQVMQEVLLLTLEGKQKNERPTLAETELGRRQLEFEARKREEQSASKSRGRPINQAGGNVR